MLHRRDCLRIRSKCRYCVGGEETYDWRSCLVEALPDGEGVIHRMTKPRRVKFVNLTLDTLPEDKVHVEVELEWRGESYHGRTEEVLLQEDIEFTCAAKAACGALNTLMADRQTTFEYLKCEPITAVGQELAVVAVAIHVDGDNQYTVGVSRVRDDPPHAAVRAVLNAANRQLSILLT